MQAAFIMQLDFVLFIVTLLKIGSLRNNREIMLLKKRAGKK